MNTYIRLLRDNPHFSRLWLAQVISLLGDWFSTIVLAALVSELSGGSGGAISLFLLTRFLPPLLVSPYTGVLVDRFNRKHLLVLSDISRALIVPLYLLADGAHLLWLIYTLSTLQWAISAVFEPGRNAIMPSLLRQDDLVIGNTLSSVTWSVMLAVGAVAGGVVAAVFGTATALLVDAATFALSALLIVQIKPQVAHVAAAADAALVSRPEDRSFRDGLRYIARNPATGAALLVKTGLSIGSVDTVLIIFATELFVLGSDGTISMSILWSAFGIGAVIGPAVTNHFNDGSVRVMRRLIFAGFVLVVAGWLLLGAAPTLMWAVFAVIGRGMGGSINWTYSSVIIQKTTRDEYLGRVFAMDMAGFQLLTAISIIGTGQLIDLVGTAHVREVIYGSALMSLIPLLLWGVALRLLERQDEAEHAPLVAGD